MTSTTPAHLAYDEASTPDEMHADCEAAASNIHVPAPRLAKTVTTTLMGAPKRAAAPVIAVTDRLAKLAGSILD
jgi:hypothetical protein